MRGDLFDWILARLCWSAVFGSDGVRRTLSKFLMAAVE